MQKNILITGGAGFIGSHVVRKFVLTHPEYNIINFDALTYAGNLENLKDIENEKNYVFIHGDITNKNDIKEVFDKYDISHVIHLAAESHVDKSINDPLAFIKTNVIGTANLLEEFRAICKDTSDYLFYHISTDEVYGTLGSEGYFTEETPYSPNSPYSASKAGSDHIVRAYGETYGIPYIISNCSNNYGPNQFPEKLIPLCINNIINKNNIPVYGNGKYTRDWLYVGDHADAIYTIFHKGKLSNTYNIGGWNEWQNIDLIELLCEKMDIKLNNPQGSSRELITFVKDRPGHDLRYAIDASKLKEELNWVPAHRFEDGIDKTIEWYLENGNWLKNVVNESYKEYYNKQYRK